MRPSSSATARVFAATLLLLLSPLSATAGGGSSAVECGQISSYIAPDPLGPTDGALGIGNLPPWTIAADATLSAAVSTTLPSLAGTGPSCFALELNGSGVITGLDFAAQGSISGPVVFDAGLGFYIFHDRLIIPPFITDMFPELAAIFVTSEAAGTNVQGTFDVDTTTGAFTGIDVHAAFCGRASLGGGGNGVVGDAVIPSEVLGGHDVNVLEDASGHRVCASVHTFGSIDAQGNIDLDTEVTIEASGNGPEATPPDTATRTIDRATEPATGVGLVLWATLAMCSIVLCARVRLGAARPSD